MFKKANPTAAEVKKVALECGADIVGIGGMDRFEGAPAQCDPRHIMPEAKSIIVMGFRIFRGLLRGIEEGTAFQNYSSLGYASINEILMPMTMWKFCSYIENAGYEAYPINNCFRWNAINTGDGTKRENWSHPVAPGKPAPDVFLHMRIAGYIAGLGEIGYSKVFLTPEFGPRVRLGAILTEAELEPDPLVEPGTICDRCKACVRNCSGQAIDPVKTVKVTIAGKELEWGELDVRRCTLAFAGNDPDECGKRTPCNPFDAEPYHFEGYGHAIEGAAGCIRSCMIHLENQGKIKNSFHEKFRRRKPWWSIPSREKKEPVNAPVEYADHEE